MTRYRQESAPSIETDDAVDAKSAAGAPSQSPGMKEKGGQVGVQKVAAAPSSPPHEHRTSETTIATISESEGDDDREEEEEDDVDTNEDSIDVARAALRRDVRLRRQSHCITQAEANFLTKLADRGDGYAIGTARARLADEEFAVEEGAGAAGTAAAGRGAAAEIDAAQKKNQGFVGSMGVSVGSVRRQSVLAARRTSSVQHDLWTVQQQQGGHGSARRASAALRASFLGRSGGGGPFQTAAAGRAPGGPLGAASHHRASLMAMRRASIASRRNLSVLPSSSVRGGGANPAPGGSCSEDDDELNHTWHSGRDYNLRNKQGAHLGGISEAMEESMSSICTEGTGNLSMKDAAALVASCVSFSDSEEDEEKSDADEGIDDEEEGGDDDNDDDDAGGSNDDDDVVVPSSSSKPPPPGSSSLKMNQGDDGVIRKRCSVGFRLAPVVDDNGGVEIEVEAKVPLGSREGEEEDVEEDEKDQEDIMVDGDQQSLSSSFRELMMRRASRNDYQGEGIELSLEEMLAGGDAEEGDGGLPGTVPSAACRPESDASALTDSCNSLDFDFYAPSSALAGDLAMPFRVLDLTGEALRDSEVVTEPFAQLAAMDLALDDFGGGRRTSFWSAVPENVVGRASDGGALPFKIFGTSAEDESARPHVLSPPMMEALQAHLPFVLSEDNFWMKYSMVRDGASLPILLQNCRGAKQTIMALETVDGECFGSFTSTPWKRTRGYYGNGESFLWRMRRGRSEACRSVDDLANAEGDLEVFRWCGVNDVVQSCTHSQISVGGGSAREGPSSSCGSVPTDSNGDEDEVNSGFGIAVDSQMLHGTSCKCVTFQSPPLSKIHKDGSPFEILNIEVWTLTPCFSEEDAENLEMRRLFIEENRMS